MVSAGNNGSFEPSIGSPGSAAAALTVGAVDREERIADFSSRGLTVDGAIKPDLTAPGVEIVAARAAGTELGTLVGDDYVSASGTSMAAPHVAGAAALLVQRHPVWSAADLEAALVGTAAYNPEFTALHQGTGRVDVPAALETTLLSSTPSLSFGVARWPHDDDPAATRTVSYRNLGAETELSFALDVSGPDGAAPPEGMFSVEPSSLTIPAGGTASVRVTANPSAGSVDGIFSGRLVASDASGRTQVVSIALERETESYDVVFQHRDREGLPAYGFGFLIGGDPPAFFIVDASPDAPDPTLRLSKGHYILDTIVDGANFEGPTTLLVAPNVTVAGDTLVELDARIADPVSLTLPVPDTTLDNTTLDYSLSTATTGLSATIGFGGGSPVYYSGLVGTPISEDALTASLVGSWSKAESLDVYNSAWVSDGALPAGDFFVEPSELATVHASYARHLAETPFVYNSLGLAAYRVGSRGYGYSAPSVEFPLERNEHYFSGHPDLRWITSLWASDESFLVNYLLDSAPADFEAGRSYDARFNAPIHGATLAGDHVFGPPASRVGDVLNLFVPTYGDGDAHEGYVPTTGSTRLYRDGELLGEVASGDGAGFEVPAGLASYRAEIETEQSLFELTTRQRLVYVFESESAPEDEPVALPLLSVRFDASLDELGQAPRGAFCLPFRIAQLGRERRKGENVSAVEVSYDDGVTWAPARVARDGASWNAFLEHPASGDYVSLRISAEDSRGNSLEQTLIRAYALAAP